MIDEYEIDEDGCWLWLGRRTPDGYGLAEGWPIRSMHRIKYAERYGPIDPGLIIDHRCHSSSACQDTWTCKHRRCCNPDHLTAITRSENSLLRYRRGTEKPAASATADV